MLLSFPVGAQLCCANAGSSWIVSAGAIVTESIIAKRQPLLRLLLLAGIATALAGCANWSWPDFSPEKRVEEQPVETAGERDAGTDSETGAEQRPAEEAGPGIATGNDAYHSQYASLKTGGHALAPQDVGYFIDVHEARLRQALAGTSVRMQRSQGRLRLIVPGTLSFETNSAEIVEEVKPILEDIAAVLAEFDKTLVSVHGHTDDRGDDAYNRKLSERRAVAVAMFLAGRGVAKERLVGIGYGEEEPVIEDDSEEARTANRRIEILIEPVVTSRKAGLDFTR